MKASFAKFSFLILFILNSNFGIGQSQIIHVFPGDSIQDSINVAQDGDTVLIEQGTYVGSIELSGKAIILASNFIFTEHQDDIDNTILVGNNTNTISFLNGDKSLLMGFTIRNDSTTLLPLGRNILCYEASPIILHNNIKEGRAFGLITPIIKDNQLGAGIFVSNSNPVIAKNRIFNNKAWLRGGGIAVNCGSPFIVENIIEENVANSGGGIYCKNSDATISGNIIDNNHIINGPGGGGIYIESSNDRIVHNTIVNNHNDMPFCCGEKGGGIMINVNSFAEVKYNIIARNTTNLGGGGLFCKDLLTLPNCTDSISTDSLNNIIESNLFFENSSDFANPDDLLLEGVCIATNNTFSIDPLFVDFNNGNYLPQFGSIIDSLGFTAAPPFSLDFDRDGISDVDEIQIHFTNKIKPDTDDDGILDWEEIFIYDTEPLVSDSDNDMHTDGFEIQMGTDPKDPNHFPDSLKIMNFGLLIQDALTLSQQPFVADTITPVSILDFPQHGQFHETGVVFPELNMLETNNPINSPSLFFTTRPRGSLDNISFQVFADNNNDQNFEVVRYRDIIRDTSYKGFCPPIDKDIIPIAGKTLTRVGIGGQQGNNDFPTLATFSSTGFGRLSHYKGFKQQVFGASHRTATYKLGDTLESFPHFNEVYLNAEDSITGRIMALVDANAFSGAVSYSITPGEVSEMKVKAYFFPRATIKQDSFGILGISSMFWKGEEETPFDSMDEAHDSDTLVVGYDENNDGIIDYIKEVRLKNPGVGNPQFVTDFADFSAGNQIYFALEQRDTTASNYDCYSSANYHQRPSISVSIISSNRPVSLKLFEFPTESEFIDNVALSFIALDGDILVGDTIIVEYVVKAYLPFDQDGDGLTNQLETLIGTCIDDSDTDGDGSSDYEELKNGENPRTDIEITVQPSIVSIEAEVNETVQTTIQIFNPNCIAAIPILNIALQEDTLFSIADTIGHFSECPYFIVTDSTFELVLEFVSSDTGVFHNSLIVTLADTIIQIPLMATVNSPTGVDKVENNKSVRLFPNPSNGDVAIYLEGWSGSKITLQLIDINGRIIRQLTRNDMNQSMYIIQLDDIPKGNYFLNLTNDKFYAIKKLTVQ